MACPLLPDGNSLNARLSANDECRAPYIKKAHPWFTQGPLTFVASKKPRRSPRGPIRLRLGNLSATRLKCRAGIPLESQLCPRDWKASSRMDAPDQGQSAAGASIRRPFRLPAQESNQVVAPYMHSKYRAIRAQIRTFPEKQPGATPLCLVKQQLTANTNFLGFLLHQGPNPILTTATCRKIDDSAELSPDKRPVRHPSPVVGPSLQGRRLPAGHTHIIPRELPGCRGRIQRNSSSHPLQSTISS